MARASNPVLDVEIHEFIAAWQTSDSVAEAKEKLGLDNTPNDRMSSRASQMRQNGVTLKSMSYRPGTKYDYDSLDQYARWVSRKVDEAAGSGDDLAGEDVSLDAFRAEVEERGW